MPIRSRLQLGRLIIFLNVNSKNICHTYKLRTDYVVSKLKCNHINWNNIIDHRFNCDIIDTICDINDTISILKNLRKMIAKNVSIRIQLYWLLSYLPYLICSHNSLNYLIIKLIMKYNWYSFFNHVLFLCIIVD